MQQKRPPKPQRRTAKPRQRRGDYRIFIAAFPEGDTAGRIQAIREQYDPKTAAILPPHVTLAGIYWRSGPATAQNEANLIGQLKKMRGKIKPFDLILGGIRSLGSRTIYLSAKPTNELLKVRATLLRLAGRDKQRRFKPHLTLATNLNKADTAVMLANLQATEWGDSRSIISIHKLHLMQSGPTDSDWQSIYTLDLA